jgi:hypothetical protein
MMLVTDNTYNDHHGGAYLHENQLVLHHISTWLQ